MKFRVTRLFFVAMMAVSVVFLSNLSAAHGNEISEFKADYSISLRNIKVAEFRIAGRSDDRSYAATGLVYTAGIGTLFTDTKLLGKVRGWIIRNTLQPFRYYGELKQRGKFNSETINYDAGNISKVVSEPARNEELDLTSKKLSNSVDPLTMLYDAFKPVKTVDFCGRQHNVFDGRRLSSYSLGEIKDSGNQVVCKGHYKLLLGFSEKQRNSNNSELSIVYEKRIDGIYQLQLLEVKTSLGIVRFKLKTG